MNRRALGILFAVVCASLILTGISFAQSNSPTSRPSKKANRRPAKPTPTPLPTPTRDDSEFIESDDEITVETNLITIPVKVLDRDGRFVPGLKKEDFSVLENKKPQEIAYFSNEEMPFTVALLLDMSYSTVFKIDEIQQAALQFVTELRPRDRVMVIGFSQDVQVMCDITSDRKTINNAIIRTSIGSGTSVYDSVDFVLNKRFAKVKGRKAIVLFTDGVDTTSESSTHRDNLRDTLESEALIYPIRYDTYADVQAIEQGKVIINDPTKPRTTPPVGGGQIPGSKSPLPFPLPTISVGGKPSSGRSLPGTGTSREDYKRASEYLDQMAYRTGGRIYDAQNNRSLARAFSKIAAELREFYSLGYYPADDEERSKRRKIKVRVNRKKISIRARDSYVLKSDSDSK